MGRHAIASPARLRKALLASGVVLGIGASASLAAWSDASWVSGVFNTDQSQSGLFQLQSAPSPDSFDAQLAQADPLARMAARRTPDGTQETTATNVAATVSLIPGQDTFVPMYLRTSVETKSDAIVSVSKALNGESDSATTPASVWGNQTTPGAPTTPGYVTYGARIQQLDPATMPPDCNLDTFGARSYNSTRLFGSEPGPTDPLDGLVPMESDAPQTQFTLAGHAQNTYMVCFRFHLDSRVVVEAPEANGAPFQPSWTFTGEAKDS